MHNIFETTRNLFHFPKKNNINLIYFCGNSLGLQLIKTEENFIKELNIWKEKAVDGHFEGDISWYNFHQNFKPGLAHLLGCKEEECVPMGSLTENIHLLFSNFFNPKDGKNAILIEEKAFSSDFYAVSSQLEFNGLEINSNLLEWKMNENDYFEFIEFEKIIEKNKNKIAIVWLGGVNYYNGQIFEIEKISTLCRKNNIIFGLDLAHAIGNIELKLHEWQVDFATWCSYKYLNGGPGAVSGIFIHEKHINNTNPAFKGWWGVDEKLRFKMEKEFYPAQGVDKFQLSNAPIFNMVGLKTSLELYRTIDMTKFHVLATELNQIIIDFVNNRCTNFLKVVTPNDITQRGCQVSIKVLNGSKDLYNFILNNNCVVDWREPHILRLATNPLYNTKEEIDFFLSLISDFYSLK